MNKLILLQTELQMNMYKGGIMQGFLLNFHPFDCYLRLD